MGEFNLSIDHQVEDLIPEDKYGLIALDAFQGLISLDANPQDLIKMLFKKEELEWMKQHISP